MNKVKLLNDLLKHTAYIKAEGNENQEVVDITADSREVGEGSLFICLCGARADGHDFAAAAAEKGASVIVAEKKISVPAHTAVVYVKDTRRAMEDLTPYFFDYPARKMRILAVTGTNGKTTSTHIEAHILNRAGFKTGVIGTIHMLIGKSAALQKGIRTRTGQGEQIRSHQCRRRLFGSHERGGGQGGLPRMDLQH